MVKGMRSYMRTLKGSFTVEAAVILPLVFIVIVTLATFGFYFHDVCVVRAAAETFIDQACYVREQHTVTGISREETNTSNALFGIRITENQKILLRNRIIQAVESQMFFCHMSQCEVQAGSSFVRAEIEIRSQLGIPLVQNILPELKCTVVEEGEIYDPVRAVRYEKIINDEFKKTGLYESVRYFVERLKGGES